MRDWKTLADIRREYGDLNLTQENTDNSPITQFEKWFIEITKTATDDPTAMVLSTVDAEGHPDSRIVLLKGIEDGAFLFYTNYKSPKAAHILATPFVALNWYWPSMARQVRIKGKIKPVSTEKSDDYFSSRPRASQLSAIVSSQSEVIPNRKTLENTLASLIAQKQELVMRPEHWGGYQVTPDEVEFWQGRDNRLHDRIVYSRKQGQWCKNRLAP